MRRAEAMISNAVLSPNPRRIHIYNHKIEANDVKARNELLDLVFNQESYGNEKLNFQVALSPPFFSCSPPTTALNPVIQDEQFKYSKLNPNPSMFEPLASLASSRMSGGDGCVGVKYNHTPAPMTRIEGFHSQNNCSFPALD